MKLHIRTPEEIAAEAQARAENALRTEARAYLYDTDWLVVRQAETGTMMPEAVLKMRAQARAVLSRQAAQSPENLHNKVTKAP